MSHESIRDELQALAGSTSGDPAGYLEGLSPIHDAWHRVGVRGYGFLLFHHRVVRYFNLIVGPALQPALEAYTDDEFKGLGVQPFDADLSRIDALGELAAFSQAIESWHNTTHGALSAATGTPLMDPRQNIYFRPFWQLHFYIDDRFVTTLGQYGNQAHPGQFVTSAAIASHIETRHHGWVPRI